jgi:integrase
VRPFDLDRYLRASRKLDLDGIDLDAVGAFPLARAEVRALTYMMDIGSWRISASAGFDPVTGKRKRVFRTVRGTRRDAQRELTNLLREIDRGEVVEQERITFADYISRWLDHMRHRLRPTTFYRYEGYVRCHLTPALGGMQLSKIRPLHIQALEAKALKSGRMDGGGGLSAQTVLHLHRVLHGALAQAVRWQLITINPAAAVQPPRVTRPKIRVPTPDEVERIVGTAEGTTMYMPVLIAVATGMRRGEILALQWRSVDLEKGLVRVVRTLQRHRHGTEIGEPKTQRGRRTIVVPEFAVEILRQHRKVQAAQRLRAGSDWRDEDLVVTNASGGPMDAGEVTRRFKRLAADAGAPGVRFHDLRHAYATMLLASGVHPKIASEALGHSTVGITLDTYSHVLPTMQAEAAAAIQKALGGLLREDGQAPDPPKVRQLRPDPEAD